MSNKIDAVKFEGVDTVEVLVNLSDEISKVMSDLVFKPANINTWGVVREQYPNGVCDSMRVFHTSDLNNPVGNIDVSNYYGISETNKPKYGIASINIQDGRHTYNSDGQHKYSINLKNIVRVAKKVFKPFTFDQIADRHRQQFSNNINSLSNNMRWELRQKTCDGFEHLLEDWENLFHLGYQPKNAKFKQMMEYIMANKEKIDKYHNYNPDYYFVLVKDGEVQYRLNSLKNDTPYKLSSKDELPDDIKGKLFVLDITDNKDFVEDIGLKENDGAYWIIA